ncbi:response regulator [Flavobacterium piscis]|uniref:CheY-like chemotaxis protein n=1 Tax=Flavobacterium piscis TaxID=1114874 RepID=A0ABU1YBK8_9FLAO|nr:response regulator [Flavobacterium piscis]MDR7211625.1 CheY-like chemotaxis protein [Flavobacterium piscis]
MNTRVYNLLLADDDEDDCDFFKEALEELLIPFSLSTVNDGAELMKFLSDKPVENLPDIVFLDLNMPRKNGLECLTEIKQNKKLQHLSVIIFSTSLNMDIVDIMYEKGAIYYIRKPGDYAKLKKVIGNALTLIPENNLKQPEREQFVLES